ncbi:MAG: DUF4365 domain-containing protein [Desulfomonilaceae bacterium]|nr:DUF4365 domain-containing protein [Desulfomonilaceae bacterium]
MEIPESYIIDKEAMQIFECSLPKAWLLLKETPDFGIDYSVDIGEVGEMPSGIRFRVQLKGTKSPQYTRDGFITKQVERDYIEYWTDRVRQPVFLVVADLQKKECYYIFMQEWALTDESWREKVKPTVRIPGEYRISDVGKFQQEVIRAEKFMRDRYPSSIEAAVAADKQKLEKLDDRIIVADIEVKEKVITYHLEARKPFSLQFHAVGDDSDVIKTKLEHLINYGSPARFGPGEACVKGSAILEEKALQLIEVQSMNKRESELTLTSIDHSGTEGESIRIPGNMTFGLQGGFFKSDSSRLPLCCSLIMRIIPKKSIQDINVTFSIDPTTWNGKPLSSLKYFDKLFAFFLSLEDAATIKLVCECEGYFLFSALHCLPVDSDFVEGFRWYLQTLDQARVVARRLKIDPPMPDLAGISDSELQEIGLLYSLITEGQYRQAGDGFALKTRMVFHQEGLQALRKSRNSVLAVMLKEIRIFDFFGIKITLGLKMSLTKARFRGDLEKVTAENKDIVENGLPCEWIGEEGSELIIECEENQRID